MRVAIIALVAVFGALQFIRPELANPPAKADFNAPDDVKAILRASCYDCHSNETKLLWFDRVVPAYWFVASDVKAARERLNFSSLGALPAAQQRAVMFEVVN